MEREVSRSEWQVVTKDADGQAQVHNLEGHRYASEPDITEDMFVRQAKPTIIRPNRTRAPKRTDRLGIVVPDIQIGYRAGEPFHDEAAMQTVQEAIYQQQPDEVILIGDAVDLAPLSRHSQRGDWAGTTQQGIDRLHTFLAQTRSNAPNSKITLLAGNHENRMEGYIRRNAGELLGIRRANDADTLGVLTLEYLLRAKELEVNYIGGYPNNEYWITDNLKAVHGDTSRSNGSTASVMVKRFDQSVIFGHTHRIEVAHRTIQQRRGARYVLAASFGTLARVDGRVPSHRYATDERNQTVSYAPNWQQGYGIVEFNKDTHQVTPIHIQGKRK